MARVPPRNSSGQKAVEDRIQRERDESSIPPLSPHELLVIRRSHDGPLFEASQSRKIQVKTWELFGSVHVGVAGASLATRPAAPQAEYRPGPRAMRAQ